MPTTRAQVDGAPTSLESELAELKEELKKMQAQLAAQHAPPVQPDTSVDIAAPYQLSNAISSREIPVPTPETYGGESSIKLRGFLYQVDLYIAARRSLFPDDKAKIVFVKSLLRKQALAWIMTYSETAEQDLPAWLSNYVLFVQEIRRVFGDPHFEKNLNRKFHYLRQMDTVNTYAVEFQSLASLLGRKDEAALVVQFYEGLKEQVKDMMAMQDPPTNLGGMVDLALRIDARLQSRTQHQDRARKNAVPPIKSRAAPPVPAATDAATDAAADSIPRSDAARAAPRRLTQQQREYRRKNNLCMYCGEADHLVRDCPQSSRRQPRPAESAPADAQRSGKGKAQE